MKPSVGVKSENAAKGSSRVADTKAEPEKIDFSKVKVEPLFEGFC